MRLHRARISSHTSGFFLCGMMLDPVQSDSGKEIKPKLGHIYIQQSAANLFNNRDDNVKDTSQSGSKPESGSVNNQNEPAAKQKPQMKVNPQTGDK